MNHEPLLRVEHLKTHFRTHSGAVARAVDGVSFNVYAGRTLAIVGESGCGKSQTAFSIMRLVDRAGFHGSDSHIWFEGKDLLSLSDSAMQSVRGNEIAMIFQEPMSSLNPLFRVGNQLAEPFMQHQHLSRRAAREKGIELLKQVRIPSPESRIDNYPHEMSGGMKQRVMIAMALACRPKLLIADEPTTALDVTIQAQILCLMRELQQQTGMGMILITHDLGIVRQMADDVCVMYAGKVAEYGSRESVFENPQHPYTRRLLQSVPKPGAIRFKLSTVAGTVPPATRFPENGCRFAERCPEALAECVTQTPLPLDCGKNHTASCLLLEPRHRSERLQVIEQLPRPFKTIGEEPILKVEDLSVHFPVKKGFFQRTAGWVRAVDGVSFTLRRGETLSLVGESGCGKTTAGQAILRLLAEARGRVTFESADIFKAKPAALKSLRRRMQMVFQDPFGSLSPRMKVDRIITEGLMLHFPELSAAERHVRLERVLNLVGLDASVANRYPHEFSGGQRQRIAIARSLILEPAFLVLDEPTSALDVSVQAQILNLLEEIQSRRELSYLFITHNLGVVEYIADQVAVMYLGKVVEYASTAALFKSPRHPYTRTLLDAVPKMEGSNHFAKIEGDVPSPLNPPPGCHFHPRCPRATELCRTQPPELSSCGEGFVSCHHPLS